MKKSLLLLCFISAFTYCLNAQIKGKLKAAGKIAKAMATGTDIKITESEEFVSKIDIYVDGKISDNIMDGAKKVTFRLNVSPDFINRAYDDNGYKFTITVVSGNSNAEMTDRNIVIEDEYKCNWEEIGAKGYLEFTYEVNSNHNQLLYLVDTKEDGFYPNDKLSVSAKLVGTDRNDYSVMLVGAKKDFIFEIGGSKMNADFINDLIEAYKRPSPISDKKILNRVYKYSYSNLTEVEDVALVKVTAIDEKPLEGERWIDADFLVKYKSGQCDMINVSIWENLSSNTLNRFVPQFGYSKPCEILDKVRNTQGLTK